MMNERAGHTVRDVRDAIATRRRFVLTSHARPDGDAIGSQMAMALALQQLGKEVRVINADPPPEPCQALPGTDVIEITKAVTGESDAVIVMECGELSRTELSGLEGRFVINIDHHVGNTLYGDVNWFDVSAAACGEMVYDVLVALDVRLTAAMASHLYVAILTDTGSFHHGHMSPRTFGVCRALVAAGADPASLARQMFDQYTVGRLKAVGAALAGMRLTDRDRVAVLTVDDVMLEAAGATLGDLEGLVNMPLSAKAVQAVVLFKASAGEPFRVSLRSKGSVDVRAVAASHGGGGHVNAAGFTLPGASDADCEDVIRQVAAAIRRRQRLRGRDAGGLIQPHRDD